MGRFEGFSRHTAEFFMALGMNNSKAFFEAHRHEYEQHLLQPFRDLAYDMAPHMLAIDAQFDARPVIGGAISRIYRDARRVRGGPPYKEYMWLGYKRRGTDEPDLGFHFDMSASKASIGLGMYSAPPARMNALRRFISENGERYKEILACMPNYNLFGAAYKRPPVKSVDATVQDILSRRFFFYQKDIPLERTFSPKLATLLQQEFDKLRLLYDFFRTSL